MKCTCTTCALVININIISLLNHLPISVGNRTNNRKTGVPLPWSIRKLFTQYIYPIANIYRPLKISCQLVLGVYGHVLERCWDSMHCTCKYLRILSSNTLLAMCICMGYKLEPDQTSWGGKSVYPIITYSLTKPRRRQLVFALRSPGSTSKYYG